jgi:hypothetical protein
VSKLRDSCSSAIVLDQIEQTYDLVVIGGPMWAFRAATPVRKFLHYAAGKFANVAFFLTLGGTPADKAFREMEALAGSPPIAALAFPEQDVKASRIGSAIRSLAASVRLPDAART